MSEEQDQFLPFELAIAQQTIEGMNKSLVATRDHLETCQRQLRDAADTIGRKNSLIAAQLQTIREKDNALLYQGIEVRSLKARVEQLEVQNAMLQSELTELENK